MGAGGSRRMRRHERTRRHPPGAAPKGYLSLQQALLFYNGRVPLYNGRVPLYNRRVPLYNRRVPLYNRRFSLYNGRCIAMVIRFAAPLD